MQRRQGVSCLGADFGSLFPTLPPRLLDTLLLAMGTTLLLHEDLQIVFSFHCVGLVTSVK